MRDHAARGSRIAFNYTYAYDRNVNNPDSLYARWGEPWLFGFPVGSERQTLQDLGLEIRETLVIGGEDSIRRYATKADGTQIGAQAIAESMARMVQAAKESGRLPPMPQLSPEIMREQQRVMSYQLAEAVVPG